MQNLFKRQIIWIIIIIFTIIWFSTLNYRSLLPPDEGRYAEIAREMFVSGDWLTPRYNNYKYFEKPPLQAWMTAFSYSLFGIGAWQARLWTGLMGYFSILLVSFTGLKLYGAKGLNAGLMLASAPLWILAGHFNSLDIGVASFMTLSLCALLLSQQNITHFMQRNWMLICWAAMALAVLSKGLIGVVLPAIVLIIYSIWTRNWRLWTNLHFFKGSLLFVLISAPWFILVSLKNPEFPAFFFINEHFARFTSDVHNRTEVIYYFLPLVIFGFYPWLPQFLRAIYAFSQPKFASISLNNRSPLQFSSKVFSDNAPVGREKEISFNKDASLIDKTQNFSATHMILIWIVVIFIFFSVSNSKLPGYILPIFPAMALLACKWTNHKVFYLAKDQEFSGKYNKPNWYWQILFILFGLVFIWIGIQYLSANEISSVEKTKFAAYSKWTVYTVIPMAIALCFSALLSNTKYHNFSFIAVAMSIFFGVTSLGLGHEIWGKISSGNELANKIKPLLRSEDAFYSVQTLHHSLPFHLEHPMIMVVYLDELAFGAKQEPEKFIPTLEAFIQTWNKSSRAFALMSHPTYKELQKLGLPMHEIARDSKNIILARQYIANTSVDKITLAQ